MAVVAGGLVAATAVGGGVILGTGGPDDRTPSRNAPAYATATVTRGAVRQEKMLPGTPRTVGRRTLRAGLAGVVTWLPAVGTRVELGQPFVAVDAHPVLLLRGTVPAFRTFERGMVPGPDVWQLESALHRRGDLRTPADARFGAATTAAIKRWQRAQGLRRTGILPFGTVVFAQRGFRVASHPTPVGGTVAVGGPALGVATGGTEVRADVPLAEGRLARRGASVTVLLPDGRSTEGRITGVARPVERKDPDSGATTVVIPTTVTPRDGRRVARFARTSVNVRFVTTARLGVLRVPVAALVALDDRRFGLEVPTPGGSTERVSVQVGLFSGGLVEVRGPRVRRGLRVVVPRT
ncbi:peptidoglycan-binding protein [Patulibacter americanus]|uniref:peptidoglycan-binding protein n=1 Tax=Patulibacter americanus TaxID=588672 RepID=UPI0003B65E90|nr:peptidoglycan-binding protein [Patulibacter americanus]